MTLRKDTLAKANGGLHQLGSGGFIDWRPGNLKITLDGDFTAAELQWLIDYMQSDSTTDEVQ